LEAIANARALAVASVAGVEERARAAREELARRGVDPATWEPVTRDAASRTGRSTGPDRDGREAADQSEDARRAAEDRHIARDLARAREALERIEARAAQEQARQEPDIDDRVPEQPIEPQRYHEPEPPVRPPEPAIERDGW
jgi:hypothetical protein